MVLAAAGGVDVVLSREAQSSGLTIALSVMKQQLYLLPADSSLVGSVVRVQMALQGTNLHAAPRQGCFPGEFSHFTEG